MGYIESLKRAIKGLHGYEAEHIESVSITETFQGETVWDGVVEVFLLQGHPKASKCYAWGYEEDSGETRYVAVLELPPVNSPQAAVKAAIVNQLKQT